MMRPTHLKTCYQKVSIPLFMLKNVQKFMIEFYKYFYGFPAPIKKEVLV